MKTLSNIFVNLPKRQKRKIVGRGVGSGRGRSSCRGKDGYNSRSGGSLGLYEGGQQPLHKRLPKRGFSPIAKMRNRYAIVTTTMIQRCFDSKKFSDGAVLDRESMLSIGLISASDRKVKLLGGLELICSVSVVVDVASKGATEAIAGCGGSVKLR